MQHGVQQRAIFLALAALLDLVEATGAEAIAPSLQLRALLAFLHACSNGERYHFDGFWKMMVDPTAGGENEAGKAYMRKTHARAHYSGIIRAVGIDQTHPDYGKRINRLRVMSNPETRARHAMAALVREAAQEREIVASKGHPRFAGPRRLLAKRLANGEPLDRFESSRKK